MTKRDKIKAALSMLLICCLVFMSVIPAQANVKHPNVAVWAQEEVELADEEGLLKYSEINDFSAKITREEFAEISVALFEKLSGKEISLPSSNPFTDTTNTCVLKAYAAGITQGTSSTTFSPSALITREQLITMLYRTMCKARPDIKWYRYAFASESDLKEWSGIEIEDYNLISLKDYKESIACLHRMSIVEGTIKNGATYVNPRNNASIQEAVLFTLRIWLFSQAHEIHIGDKLIQLNQTTESLIKLLGQPVRIDSILNSSKVRYIYNPSGNYRNYMMVTVENGIATEIYIAGVDTVFGFSNKLGEPASVLREIYLDYQTVSIYKDQNDNNRAVGIRYKAPNSYAPAEVDTTTYEKAASLEIWELTNAFRVFNNLSPLQWDDTLAKTAYDHSADMEKNNYFSHYSQDGRSPFQRMKNNGVKYGYAGENIAAGYQDSIAAVIGWINSSGHRENMLEPHFKKLGVGSSINYEGSSLYKYYYTQNFTD